MSRALGISLGTAIAPLPMVLFFTLAILVMSEEIGTVLVVTPVILGYLFALIPLVLSYIVLRLLGWQRLGAYAGVMFVITFGLTLLSTSLVDMSPDSRISIEYDDGSEQNVDLVVAGVIISLVVGAINALGMAIFWRLAVRACRDATVEET
ncbi:MAG: hypothetical protein QNJ00_16990 [Woeseiaceae bacterium]|nr:hypothetical protein [Woeseiaceae bacterium]